MQPNELWLIATNEINVLLPLELECNNFHGPVNRRKQFLNLLLLLKQGLLQDEALGPNLPVPLNLFTNVNVTNPIYGPLRKRRHLQFVEGNLKSEGNAPQCLTVHAN